MMKEILKDKNLLTEITRIREMMGVQILNEQAKPFADILTQLLTSRGSGSYSKRIAKLLGNPNTSEIKKLFDEIKGNPKVNIGVKKIITDFEEEIVNRYMEKKYTKMIKDGLSEGLTKRQITTKITNDLKSVYGDFADENILAKFRANLSKRFDNLKLKTPSPRQDTETIPPKTETTPPKTETTPPKTEEPDLSSEIPDSELVTTEMGPVPKIFKLDTWNSADFVNLSDESIELLLKQPFWEKAILYFQNLFIVTNGQLRNIQKLAKALETTKDAELMVKLERKLTTELVSLFKNNTNNFVRMKKYFDSLALQPGNRDWARIWRDIKSESNGGWDFYKTFGSIKEVSTWDKFWGGILDNLGVLFETEKKITAKLWNKVFKTNWKPNMVGDFQSVFKSGSRRGFPSLNNKQYEELIKKYGPGAAKFSYFRDLVVSTLKYNIYLGLLITIRNWISSFFYQDDIAPCVRSKDMNSKECNDLITNLTGDEWDDWFRRHMAKWAIQYEKNGGGSKDFIASFIGEVKDRISPLTFDIIEGDKWYKVIAEIASLDPGFIGDVILDLPLSTFNIVDNPARRDELINSLNGLIDVTEQNLEKSKRKVEDEVNTVIDDVVTGNIDDSEPGFRLWCQRNEKEFVGYNVDNDGLGRTNENGVITTWLWNNDTKTFKEY